MPRASFRPHNFFNGLSGLLHCGAVGRRGRRACALLLAAAWCLCVGALDARAQNIQYTGKSADLGLRSDFKVNPSTHGLELRIPLAEYPGRAGTSIPFALNYSSKVWRMKYATFQSGVTFVAAVYGEHSQGGWTFSSGFPTIDTEPQRDTYNAGGGPTGGDCTVGGANGSTCCFIDRVMVRMPDGSTHELRSTDTPVCYINSSGGTSITPPDDMYAVDGSRLRYRKSTGELFLPDGSRYVLGGAGGGVRYIDRNGNVLSYDGTQWTDTLSRTLGGRLPVSSGNDDPVLSLPGVGNTTIDYTLRWRQLSAPGVLSDGEQLSYTTNTTCPGRASGNHPNTLFGGGPDSCIVTEYPVDPLVLYQVVLPTGQVYTFNYNRYGEVSKVTYPTGGYERFDYGRVEGVERLTEPYASANRGVTSRFVSAKGSSSDEVPWHYTSGEAGASQFIQGEITPDGTLTERLMHRSEGSGAGFGYSFNQAMGGMAYEERVWSAPDPSDNNNRHLLRRKLTKWVATGSNATYRPDITVPSTRNGRVAKVVEILLDTNGGPALAKVTTYEYNLAYEFTTGANLKAVNEYDYVSVDRNTAQTAGVDSFAPPTQWLRRTEYDYLDDVDASYRQRNILGLQKETRVKDSSGTVVARTVVGYDQFAVDGCPQIINHDPAYGTGFTVRGNATSVTSYAGAAASTGAVTTATHYDEAGNAVSATDANGNVSTVSFADNFSDFGNARHTYAYPTGRTTAAPNPVAVPNPSGGPNFAAGTFGSTAGFSTSTTYDFRTGRVTSTTDANGQTTAYDFNDPLNRLKRVDLPDGGRVNYSYVDTHQCGAYVETRSLLDDAGREVASWQFFDGLGRPYLSERGEYQEAGAPFLRVDTVYDSSGRVSQVSNQYRASGCAAQTNPSGLWTTTEYDALGRVKKVTTPDGASATASYNGNVVTVNDQHAPGTPGHPRRRVTDGLGRLVRVDEPDSVTGALDDGGGNPVQPTYYTYDVLGNLRTVTQTSGQVTQTRTFVYDSLSRLTSATNPESGKVSYGYDGNGNVISRSDARGVQTAYTYDGLNRNIIVHYAGGNTPTPDARRYYDKPGASFHGLGRLWWTETVGVSANVFDGYDVMGRPTQYHQVFWTGSGWGANFSTQFTYNKAGGVTSQTYPSGHTVGYQYDALGRLGDGGGQPAFKGTLGDGVERAYASQVRYDQLGGMSQEMFGTQTPVYNKHLYNVRGQLAEIRVSTYSNTSPGQETNWNRGAIINHYGSSGWGVGSGGPDNNGNLRQQDVFIPKFEGTGYDQGGNYDVFTQNFTYDALNRLKQVVESGGGLPPRAQGYDYDRWGNRTINAGATSGAPAPQFSVDPVTNRLGVPAGQSGRMDYDAAGNLVNDSYTPLSYGSQTEQQTRFYDAEGRMTSAPTGATQPAVYVYDADGRRVKRLAAGAAGDVWHVYGAGGELLAEYAPNAAPTSPQKEYGYRDGELLVTAEPSSAGWGPAPVLQDNPLAAGQTYVRSQHITELRDAINALRAHRGMGAYQWQSTAAQGAPVKADPIVEMRAALDEALGAPVGGYSPGLAQGQAIKAIHIQELRNRVFGAWQAGGVPAVRWLVADHLGTPRMVVDQTGSLSGVSRHDYLPFGEELFADAGGRTTTQGYSVGDNVRQKFTAYERDGETGLDFALARYYAARQGRFTSADPMLASGVASNPKTWNRYAYALNNPLRFYDPTGLVPQDGFTIKNACEVGSAGCHPVDMGTVTVTARTDDTPVESPGESLVANTSLQFTPWPTQEPPSDDFMERFVSSPVRTGLEVINSASQAVKQAAYDAAPDFATVDANIPILVSGQLTLSKDLNLYGGVSIIGGSGGGVSDFVGMLDTFKLRLPQVGIGYYVSPGVPVTPEDRDRFLDGPDINASVGFITGSFSLDKGESPALIIGSPSYGVNVSHSSKLMSFKDP